MALLTFNDQYTVYDFESENKSGQWRVINDGVMGGLSESSIQLNSDGSATFKGFVSLENNGGFASVRSNIDSIKQGDFKGVSIRLKGDGSMYSLRFRTNKNFDGYAYQAKIKTEKDKWKEYNISFNDFKPTFRGYTLDDKPVLKSDDIAQIGLLISDRQSGYFELSIDWIKLYK